MAKLISFPRSFTWPVTHPKSLAASLTCSAIVPLIAVSTIEGALDMECSIGKLDIPSTVHHLFPATGNQVHKSMYWHFQSPCCPILLLRVFASVGILRCFAPANRMMKDRNELEGDDGLLVQYPCLHHNGGSEKTPSPLGQFSVFRRGTT